MTETYTPDNLIAGDFPIVTKQVTVNNGQNLQRGALLGRITVSGNVNLSLAAAGDGSEDPYAILAENVDASAGDKVGTAYLTGEFNEDAITFGTGHDAASVEDLLRVYQIYLRQPA